MGAIGGSIESITLQGRIFAVTSDSEVNRKLGGFENEIQSNGDGSARQIKTRVPWMLDGLVVEVDDLRGDHEFLQSLSDQKDYYPVTITYASGVTYQGTGQVVGETQYSSQSSSASVSLAGEGNLVAQA